MRVKSNPYITIKKLITTLNVMWGIKNESFKKN